MPYTVEHGCEECRKKGKEWCIKKRDGGKVVGCSDSKEKAKASVRAIYANENAKGDRLR